MGQGPAVEMGAQRGCPFALHLLPRVLAERNRPCSLWAGGGFPEPPSSPIMGVGEGLEHGGPTRGLTPGAWGAVPAARPDPTLAYPLLASLPTSPPFPYSSCFEVYFPTFSLEFFPSFPCSGGGAAERETLRGQLDSLSSPPAFLPL